MTAHLRAKRDAEGWDYVELRPTDSIATNLGLEDSERFVFHRLDLRRNPDEIFASVHKNCVQRKIRRAEKAGVTVEEGTADALLKKFYRLLVMTRRRHGLPAQPIEWFKNLVSEFGSNLTISVASSAGQPSPESSPSGITAPWFTSTVGRTGGSVLWVGCSCCYGEPYRAPCRRSLGNSILAAAT